MSYEDLKPAQAHERMTQEEGWTYLDVRTVEEFEAGHPAGAFNVPIAFRDPAQGMVMNEDFVAAMQKHFATDRKLVVGCAAGGRSARACEVLAQLGYGSLVNVEGGFGGVRDMSGAVVEPGWEACSLPVESGSPEGRTWQALQG